MRIGFGMGPSAFMPDLRPCRLLRRFTNHATAFHQTRHPIIEGYDRPKAGGVLHDEVMLDLSDRATAQRPDSTLY